MLSYNFGFKSRPGYYQGLRLKRDADGAAYLLVGGQLLMLRAANPDPGQVSLEYAGNIQAGSDAQPRDAHDLRKVGAAGE
jgi:hypothetical protein